MRIAALLLGSSVLLCPAAARAQEKKKDPFKGPTRVVKDVGSKIQVTIPEKWKEREVSGTTILSVFAPGNLGLGGHGLLLVREEGQADLKRQRDRYKAYDGGKDEAATFEMIDEPFFGYRCHLPSGKPKKLIIRRFMIDTPDGLVLSVTSRLNSTYDRMWKDQIYAIVASARAAGSSAGGGSTVGSVGAPKRFFSEDGRASLVTTDKWRTFETIEEGALVAVRFGVGGAAPSIVLADRGYAISAPTVLAQLAGRLKKRHPQIKKQTLRGSPPRMLLKGRREGSVDYVMAFKSGTSGYTLMLTVQEPEYDRFRTFCDGVAASLVLSGQAYTPPEQPKGTVTVELGAHAVAHGEPENKGLVERTAGRLKGFKNPWKRVGVGKSKNRPPVRILVVPDSRFREATELYGELPAVYHPGRRLVILTPPPKENYERWRGRAYYALGEALLHRDLRVAAPAWLKEGVCACMESAGRSGKSAQGRHPALGSMLVDMATTESEVGLEELQLASPGNFHQANGPRLRAAAWGYVHLFVFGRSPGTTYYKRWVKDLEKASKKAPKFPMDKFTEGTKYLRKHVIREWGRSGG